VIKIKLILLFLLLIVACTPTLECEAPYINSDDGCCIDENSNAVCDADDLIAMQDSILEKLEAKDMGAMTPDESKYIAKLYTMDDKTEKEMRIDDLAKEMVSGKSPDDFLPEKCTFPSGIACLEYGYNDTVWIKVNNAGGFDLLDVIVNLESDVCNSTIEIDNFESGEERVFNFGCPGLTEDVKGEITVSYTNSVTALKNDKKGGLVLRI